MFGDNTSNLPNASDGLPYTQNIEAWPVDSRVVKYQADEANLPKQGTCTHDTKCTSRNKGPCWQISRQLLQMQLGGDFGEDAAADADAAVRRAVGKGKGRDKSLSNASVEVL